MTTLLIWACVLALTPVAAGLSMRAVLWMRERARARDALQPR